MVFIVRWLCWSRDCQRRAGYAGAGTVIEGLVMLEQGAGTVREGLVILDQGHLIARNVQENLHRVSTTIHCILIVCVICMHTVSVVPF